MASLRARSLLLCVVLRSVSGTLGFVPTNITYFTPGTHNISWPIAIAGGMASVVGTATPSEVVLYCPNGCFQISGSSSVSFANLSFSGSRFGRAVTAMSVQGLVLFQHCIFLDNQGGGLQVQQTSSRIIRVIATSTHFIRNAHNTAPSTTRIFAAAIDFSGTAGYLSCWNCTFALNLGVIAGGAVSINGEITAEFANCSFVQNTVSFTSNTDGSVSVTEGAAVVGFQSNMSFLGCSFVNNTVNGPVGQLDPSLGSVVLRGAAISSLASTLRATECEFSGNSVQTYVQGKSAAVAQVMGGAIYSECPSAAPLHFPPIAAVNLSKCVFSNNVLNGTGGAQSSVGGAVALVQVPHAIFYFCNFTDNFARSCETKASQSASGGALFAMLTSSLVIAESSFTHNLASRAGYGGALMLDESHAVLRLCSFEHNVALSSKSFHGSGGAVSARDAVTLILDRCFFRSNSVADFPLSSSAQFGQPMPMMSGRGGALSMFAGSTVSATDTIFEYNVAYSGQAPDNGMGGAVSIAEASAPSIFIRCRFVGNSAVGDSVHLGGIGGRGGAVSILYALVLFQHSYFSKNWVTSGSGLARGGALYISHQQQQVNNAADQRVPEIDGCVFSDNIVFGSQHQNSAGPLGISLVPQDQTSFGPLVGQGSSGGAVFFTDTELWISNSTFKGSNATCGSQQQQSYAGALSLIYSMLNISDCTFLHSFASNGTHIHCHESSHSHLLSHVQVVDTTMDGSAEDCQLNPTSTQQVVFHYGGTHRFTNIQLRGCVKFSFGSPMITLQRSGHSGPALEVTLAGVFGSSIVMGLNVKLVAVPWPQSAPCQALNASERSAVSLDGERSTLVVSCGLSISTLVLGSGVLLVDNSGTSNNSTLQPSHWTVRNSLSIHGAEQQKLGLPSATMLQGICLTILGSASLGLPGFFTAISLANASSLVVGPQATLRVAGETNVSRWRAIPSHDQPDVPVIVIGGSFFWTVPSLPLSSTSSKLVVHGDLIQLPSGVTNIALPFSAVLNPFKDSHSAELDQPSFLVDGMLQALGAVSVGFIENPTPNIAAATLPMALGLWDILRVTKPSGLSLAFQSRYPGVTFQLGQLPEEEEGHITVNISRVSCALYNTGLLTFASRCALCAAQPGCLWCSTSRTCVDVPPVGEESTVSPSCRPNCCGGCGALGGSCPKWTWGSNHWMLWRVGLVDPSEYSLCACSWITGGEHCEFPSMVSGIAISVFAITIVSATVFACSRCKGKRWRKRQTELLKNNLQSSLLRGEPDYDPLDEASSGVLALGPTTSAYRIGEITLLKQALALKEVQIHSTDLQLGQCIGEGAFGVVWRASWKGSDVAVKVLHTSTPPSRMSSAKRRSSSSSSSDSEESDAFVREAYLMSKLRHPHIILLLGVVFEPTAAVPRGEIIDGGNAAVVGESSGAPASLHLAVVTEYMGRGSLFDIMRNPRSAVQLDYSRVLQCALHAALGMSFLHALKPPICHRDLKSSNLVVDKQWVVKVTDFGTSRRLRTRRRPPKLLSVHERRERVKLAATSTLSRRRRGSSGGSSSGSSNTITSPLLLRAIPSSTAARAAHPLLERGVVSALSPVSSITHTLRSWEGKGSGADSDDELDYAQLSLPHWPLPCDCREPTPYCAVTLSCLFARMSRPDRSSLPRGDFRPPGVLRQPIALLHHTTTAAPSRPQPEEALLAAAGSEGGAAASSAAATVGGGGGGDCNASGASAAAATVFSGAAAIDWISQNGICPQPVGYRYPPPPSRTQALEACLQLQAAGAILPAEGPYKAPLTSGIPPSGAYQPPATTTGDCVTIGCADFTDNPACFYQFAPVLSHDTIAATLRRSEKRYRLQAHARPSSRFNWVLEHAPLEHKSSDDGDGDACPSPTSGGTGDDACAVEEGRVSAAAAAASPCLDGEVGVMTSNIGTIRWEAPELFTADTQAAYSLSVDTYSFGVVLWELYTRDLPFRDLAQNFDVIAAVRKGDRPPLPSHCPLLYRQLITDCWDSNPAVRPSFPTIVARLRAAIADHRQQQQQQQRGSEGSSEWSASGPLLGLETKAYDCSG